MKLVKCRTCGLRYAEEYYIDCPECIDEELNKYIESLRAAKVLWWDENAPIGRSRELDLVDEKVEEKDKNNKNS